TADMPRSWRATSGSSAHSALAGSMNAALRTNTARYADERRTQRAPAPIAPTTRPAGSDEVGVVGRATSNTATRVRNETALARKTAPGPRAANRSPPAAGPTARATFRDTPLSATAAGRSSRRTRLGAYAC